MQVVCYPTDTQLQDKCPSGFSGVRVRGETFFNVTLSLSKGASTSVHPQVPAYLFIVLVEGSPSLDLVVYQGHPLFSALECISITHASTVSVEDEAGLAFTWFHRMLGVLMAALVEKGPAYFINFLNELRSTWEKEAVKEHQKKLRELLGLST